MGPDMLFGVGLIAVPVLLSLTLHEFAHARVALAFGDDTARRMGRVTLNPLAHLDVLGTLCFLFGPFGWAKPVPVDPTRLRPYRLGEVCVSLAGVVTNLLMALVAAGALNAMAALGVAVKAGPNLRPTPADLAAFMISYLLIINLTLAAFNLIPLFPLDGHHVLRELLPRRHRAGFMAFQRHYGRFVLLGLLVLPWLSKKLGAPIGLDPIGTFLGVTIFPAVRTVLTFPGQSLFYSALVRFLPLLPWG